MSLQVHQILDFGTHNSERVILNVLADCDLKYSMICDTTYLSESSISNKLRHMFWFSPKEVKKGDSIILYTKKGKDSSEKQTNGSTIHTFYWGLDSSVWNNSGDAAILFSLKTWNTTKVNKK